MITLIRYCLKYGCLLLIIMAVVYCLPGFAQAADKADKPSTNSAPVTDVETATVKAETIPLTVAAVGSIASYQQADLSTAVDGHVEDILFKNGDAVNKGDLILKLDLAQVEANLQSAKAALKLAQLTLVRYLQVQKSGGTSTQIINKAQADVSTNLAAVQTAQAAVAQKKIYAPFSGHLDAFAVNVGDYVTAGQKVVTLVNNDNVRISYEVPQRFVSQLALKQSVAVIVDGLANKVFDGSVSFISPSVDRSTRTVTVEATLSNKQGELKPGMFAHITQQVGEAKNRLVVPEQAITASLSGDFVFKVVNHRAVSTPVTVGQRFSGFAEISNGLHAGDIVVTAGIQKLTDGSLVKITGNFSGKTETSTLKSALTSGLGNITVRVPYAPGSQQAGKQIATAKEPHA